MSDAAYPIEYTLTSMDHAGGTKSYHLILATNANGKGIVVFRWGKKGAFGDLKIERFDTIRKAELAYENKMREKTRGGYRIITSGSTKKAENDEELRRLFGPIMWPKIDAASIAHLLPDAPVAGRREPTPPRFDENGDFLGEAPPRVDRDMLREMADAKVAQAERELEPMKNDPRFGMF